jgi:hypothetical protein
MMSSAEPGHPYLPRAPGSMMDYPFGGGPDGLGFNPPSGNQGIPNSQANNNRPEGFGFPNSQTNNQGNAIANRESNW